MNEVKLDYKDLLVVDPCYIKDITTLGEQRFDALRLVRVLHDGDDGVFLYHYDNEPFDLGVDSGRVWALQAEFECEATLDAGYSGYKVIPQGNPDLIKKGE